MADYIEREGTVRLLQSLGSRDYRREKGTIQEAIKMVSSSEYTPAADVVPVRHGKWNKPLDRRLKNKLRCSECFSLIHIVSCDRYCPHCGAKMDGEGDHG